MRKKGSSRMRASCRNRKNRYPPVRARIPMLRLDMIAYESGMAPATGSPKAKYIADQRIAAGIIIRLTLTINVFSRRKSSLSPGSAPIWEIVDLILTAKARSRISVLIVTPAAFL
jgi:hypothetical protein